MLPSARPITVLVVDDEPHARAGLTRMLASRPDLTVVGECGDGGSALRAIRGHKPDLVLLDVQMPPPDGLGVVRALGMSELPAVVFITAHDHFAVRAFEAHALDYLVKPFSQRRLFQAIDRVREHLDARRMGEMGRRLMQALAETGGLPAPDAGEPIVVKSIGKTELVPVSELIRIDAAGYCVKLHTRTGVIVHREPLYSLATRLPAGQFARVHRSAIVSIPHVREARVTATGEHELVMQDGARIPVSRSHWGEVQARLSGKRGPAPR
ncbi:MAG TPA: LytTR family DNA-binding domain-containing protein [Gemmatimonadales bacterium]|nr:LytTR family DNA-binding domain-containing protein [Gemmatimonadales bacterium]